MPKPSVFAQVEATNISTSLLKESPRHWNCGMFRYRDRLWLCYRYHLKESGGRCATAICQISEETHQPIGPSQCLKLSGPTGTEHHEDARLFLFQGDPYVSYTEMRGYQPGVDYTCVIKYSKLKLVGKQWVVEKTWQPSYGRNTGYSKEKNWVFFESEGKLFCLYEGHPRHLVLEMDGAKVVREYDSPTPSWPWGILRGGTSPIPYDENSLITFFHSSLATEEPPHFVRYHAAAYIFENKPPFRVLKISKQPIFSGSEEDGHQVDPRYVAGWKPYVVFPCGAVPVKPKDHSAWLVSFGVNDWQCAVAKIKSDCLYLGSHDGSDIKARFFKTPNGSLPVKMLATGSGAASYLQWFMPTGGYNIGVREGYMKLNNSREAHEVAELPGVMEISGDEYESVTTLVTR